MTWWNPLSWFAGYDPATAKAADVLDQADVIEDGKAESVQVLLDGAAAADKYLFEVQTLEKTGEVVNILPFGEKQTPYCISDRGPKFVMVKALLTIEEAARLKVLAKARGGDGMAKTADDLAAEAPPPEPVDLPASAHFTPEALAIARPDQVLKVVQKIALG